MKGVGPRSKRRSSPRRPQRPRRAWLPRSPLAASWCPRSFLRKELGKGDPPARWAALFSHRWRLATYGERTESFSVGPFTGGKALAMAPWPCRWRWWISISRVIRAQRESGAVHEAV